MRFVIGVVLALSVGIGAYLGSAQVADSAKTPPRRVTLQVGDIATVGQVRCRGFSNPSRQRPHPILATYLRCSTGPLSRAAASVAVMPGLVDVGKKAGQVSCFLVAPGHRNQIFSAYLGCTKGPRHAGPIDRGAAGWHRRLLEEAQDGVQDRVEPQVEQPHLHA